MPDIEKLLKLRRIQTKEGGEMLSRAVEFAKKAHNGQKRKSGEPYFNHSFETALKIAEWGLDNKVIAAALLHDVLEDGNCTAKEVKQEFGDEIIFLVQGVTKLGYFKYHKKNEREEIREKTANFRKMILALSEDLRVIFIKLADRLHNMKTLQFLPLQKQKRIALETYDIYASLAYRLGMTNLAGELSDLALPYLYPEDYKWLLKNVPEKYEKREEYLTQVKEVIEKELKENSLKSFLINFRAKRYSSLHKKLKRYNMNFEEIYDLVAMRIVVDTVEDCYKTLGIIHHLYPPLPGRIKDYIALPKPNGYQSIHTTVFCLNNKITEFQIRTQKMHEEAEYGIAAHWAYEEQKHTKSYAKHLPVFAEKKELAWIKQLKDWQEKFGESGEEFINSLKVDFFKDRIFVVTPKGDVIDLPVGATPVDFAYQIHSDIGNQCVGAKVNGKIVPLNYGLESGNVVEILTQKGKKPSESWHEFVKTSMAREHIKKAVKEKRSAFLRKSQKKKSRA